MSTKQRPLSPHLQVYKPQVTTAFSIFHRATGVALSIGLIVFTWWIVALSIGGDTYVDFLIFANSVLGKIMLVGWTWAACWHLCTGIRHLFLDMGYGFEIPTVYKTATAILIVSSVLTVAIVCTAFLGVSL